MYSVRVLSCLGLGLALALVGCVRLDGTTDATTLASEATGRTYEIKVYTPEGVEPDEAAVLYVLDGDWRFNATAEALDDALGDGKIPPTVMVSIGYGSEDNAREQDYTPVEDLLLGGSSGEGERFADFLEDELFPWFEATYDAPADPERRAIFGHSLGGLFVTWFWMTRPELVRGVIAASPSYWYGEGYIFGVLDGASGLAGDIYVNAGGQEEGSMIGLSREMRDRLDGIGAEVDVAHEVIGGRGHMSVVDSGLEVALPHVLTRRAP